MIYNALLNPPNTRFYSKAVPKHQGCWSTQIKRQKGKTGNECIQHKHNGRVWVWSIQSASLKGLTVLGRSHSTAQTQMSICTETHARIYMFNR